MRTNHSLMAALRNRPDGQLMSPMFMPTPLPPIMPLPNGMPIPTPVPPPPGLSLAPGSKLEQKGVRMGSDFASGVPYVGPGISSLMKEAGSMTSREGRNSGAGGGGGSSIPWDKILNNKTAGATPPGAGESIGAGAAGAGASPAGIGGAASGAGGATIGGAGTTAAAGSSVPWWQMMFA